MSAARPVHGFWEITNKPSEGLPVVAIVEETARVDIDGIPVIVVQLAVNSPLLACDLIVPMAVLPVGDPPRGVQVGDELVISFKLRACRVCGCTKERACANGCFWIDADLCSRCETPVIFGFVGTAGGKGDSVNNKRIEICWILVVIIVTLTYAIDFEVFGQTPQPPILIDVRVPRGMPVNVEWTRDKTEQTINKYVIRYSSSTPVTKIVLVSTVVIQVIPGSGSEAALSRVTSMLTEHPDQPASIAWAASVNVTKLYLIVERVETPDGIWVLDSHDPKLDVKAILAGEDLPPGRWIPR